MMASKSRSKSSSGSRGGSRILTYLLIAMIAGLVGYYVVLPAFVPHGTTTTTGVSTTGNAKITLNPSTDISGASVSLVGEGLAPNVTVEATFGSSALGLNGTCTTSASGSLSGCTFWVPKTASGSYTVAVTAGSSSGAATFHVPRYSPPVSTLLVTLTSIALGVTTQLVTRKTVDLDAERKLKAEVNAFNKEKREATLANDKVKLDKLKKRQLQVTQAQAKLSTGRLKVTAITFIPLLLVYYLMATFMGGYGVIVAYTPIPIPVFAAATQYASTFQVSLFWWYFLSSFAFSSMLSKLLHTTT